MFIYICIDVICVYTYYCYYCYYYVYIISEVAEGWIMAANGSQSFGGRRRTLSSAKCERQPTQEGLLSFSEIGIVMIV